MKTLPFLFDAETVARIQELLGTGWPGPWRALTLLGPGNRLYVTRGIGMSLLPLRINAPPELTYLTLRAAPPRSRP